MKKYGTMFLCMGILSANASELAYTVSDLNWGHPLELSGAKPTSAVYIPIPVQMEISQATLNLNVEYSPLLLNTSSLTVQVNGDPVSSLMLTNKNNGKIQWRVDIPTQYVKAGSLAGIRFVGFLRVTDDICADYSNPASWLRVDDNSALVLQYRLLDFAPSLAQFPYPFIAKQSMTPGQALLVVPDQTSGHDLVPALRVASVLGAQATFRGVDVDIASESQLSNDQKKNQNLIFVGVQNKFAALPNTSDTLTEKDGLLMMGVSPFSDSHALLEVTSASLEGVDIAARMLMQPGNLKIIKGNRWVVTPESLEKENHAIDWKNVTLEELGYKDQAAIGFGASTLSYTLDLPNNKIPKMINMNMLLSHSPFEKTDNSQVSIAVNGVNQAGVLINESVSEKKDWPISIEDGVLKPGKNIVDFIFDLNTAQYGCATHYDFRNWGVIFAQSVLNIAFRDGMPNAALSDFPIPFSDNTWIVIPNEVSEKTRAGLVKYFTQIGVLFGKSVGKLHIVTSDAISYNDLKGKDSVLIGFGKNNPVLTDVLAKEMPVIKEKTKSVIALLNRQKNKTLVISAEDEESFLYALNLMTNPGSQIQLKGTVAYVTSYGTLMVMDNRNPEVTNYIDLNNMKSYQTVNKKEKFLNKIFGNYSLLFMLMLGITTIILAAISYYIRHIKNKKKETQ